MDEPPGAGAYADLGCPSRSGGSVVVMDLTVGPTTGTGLRRCYELPEKPVLGFLGQVPASGVSPAERVGSTMWMLSSVTVLTGPVGGR